MTLKSPKDDEIELIAELRKYELPQKLEFFSGHK